jgi:hypothetical protein
MAPPFQEPRSFSVVEKEAFSPEREEENVHFFSLGNKYRSYRCRRPEQTLDT